MPYEGRRSGDLRLPPADADQETLHETLQLFRVLAENMRDVFFVSTPDLEAIYVSPAYEEIWGRSRQSLSEHPRSWLDALHPEDRLRAAQALDAAGAAENGWSVEYRVVRPDGSTRWIRSKGFPLKDVEGRVYRLSGIAEDITSWKMREEALLEAKLAAEQTSMAKSEFLANISHELRTPLNAVIGFSELLADGSAGALSERQSEYLDHVLASGRHLLDLINDLLDLAKIEAERTDLEPADFDLASLLFDLAEPVLPMAEKQRLLLSLDLAKRMPVIRADARRVRQVVWNLLSNALKFTPAGGRVTLKARWLPTAADGSSPGPRFKISVEDTGIGIRPEDQGRLFRVFEQIDSSYARVHRGTGLGLALCRRLVEMHGGRIWVESAGEGQGSSFHFEIPASPAAREEQA